MRNAEEQRQRRKRRGLEQADGRGDRRRDCRAPCARAGLLESAYAACLETELTERGLAVRRQLRLPLRYRGRELNYAYRIDMLVASRLVVELKAVDTVLQLHKAQLLSYLRLTNLRLGLLINFNVEVLTHGISRIINPDLNPAAAPAAPSAPPR